MQAPRGRGSIAPTYFDLVTRLGGPRPGHALTAEKDPRYPMDRRLVGLESCSGPGLEEKSFTSAGDRIPVSRTFSLQSDTILTELPQLLYS
jgi:hypothetical protein